LVLYLSATEAAIDDTGLYGPAKAEPFQYQTQTRVLP
jgi:hypothetical protein